MSRMYEDYDENGIRDEPEGLPEMSILIESDVENPENLSEKDICKLFGVNCSFGICDECSLIRGNVMY